MSDRPTPDIPGQPPTAAPPAPPTGPAAPEDWWTDQPEVPLAEAPAASTRSWRTYAAIGVGAAALVIAAIVGAGAIGGRSNVNAAAANGTAANGPQLPGGANGGFARRGTRGTIAKIDGSTITVNAVEGRFGGQGGTQSSPPATTTVTVETSDSTKVTEAVAGAVSDVKVGDNVLVVGATTDGTVAATRITDDGDQATTFGGGQGFPGGRQGEGAPPTGQGSAPQGAPGGGQGFPGGGLTAGSVTAVDGTTLTVETQAGATVKVTTTADTTVTVTKAITLADLAPGDTIQVTGDTSGTTVTATAIRKGDGGGGFPGGAPPAGGAVPGQTPTTI